MINFEIFKGWQKTSTVHSLYYINEGVKSLFSHQLLMKESLLKNYASP